MTSEELALQIGQIKGVLEQIVRQNDHQSGQLNRIDGKVEQTRTDLTTRVDQVRTELTGKIDQVNADFSGKVEQVRKELSAKIDTDVKVVADRVTGVEARVQKAEIDVAKKSVVVAGGATIMMMAIAEGLRTLFKLKGGG